MPVRASESATESSSGMLRGGRRRLSAKIFLLYHNMLDLWMFTGTL